MKPTKPITIPTLVISLVSTIPVAEAMAFGGVEMGNSMAMEAQTAMKVIMAEVPPMPRNWALLAASGSAIPLATTIRIGISRAAVARLEMKLDRQ